MERKRFWSLMSLLLFVSALGCQSMQDSASRMSQRRGLPPQQEGQE